MISLTQTLRRMIHLDILPREVLILNELSTNPGLCRTDLATNIGFKASSSIYPALRRLIDRGWVIDEKPALCGRSDPSILSVTPHGRGVLTDLSQGVETT